MFFGLFKSKTKVVTVKRKKNAEKTKKVLKIKRAKVKKSKKPIIRKTRKISRPKKALPEIVGRVTHYFPHVKVGVVIVSKNKIALGDKIHIKGHTTDFKQKISSMQINNAPINEAKKGEEIGILLKSRVRHNDVVYKI